MSQAGKYALGSGVLPPIETLEGNSGGPVGPDAAGNILILGVGAVDVVGTPAINTLAISISGVIPDTFPTDTGTAIPAAGVLNVLSGATTLYNNTNTFADPNLGNTIRVRLNDYIQLPATNAALTEGNIQINGARFMHAFGTSSTFLGTNAGNTTLTGNGNTGIGTLSGSSLSTGIANGLFGNGCGIRVTTGSRNVGVGGNALSSSGAVGLTTGSDNTAVGNTSLATIDSGSRNLALGSQTGSGLTLADSDNILLHSSGAAGNTNTLRIGAATGAGNYELNRAFICGIDGVNVGSTAKVVTMGTGGTVNQLGTAVITAGTGVTIGTSANAITVNVTGGGVSWSVITLDQTAAVNNGYFCNKAGTLLLALPASSSVGQVIEVSNINTALGIQFTQAAGQQIFIGNTSTTLGAAGTLTTTAVGDALKIVCRTANTIWQVVSVVGNWTPA